jgi:ATP-dependent RNA helicase DeaD
MRIKMPAKTTAQATTTFQELGVSPAIIKALEENGFETPFPIQRAAIPLVLKGVDVIGQAHTGSGKTAAFALPILTKIKTNHKGPIQALILVPTRELALQVANEFNKFAKYTGIRTIAIYGGQSIAFQFKQLRRGVQIVVATPGRLIDHVKQDSIRLDNVKFVVLDEADRMLDMGFIDDIKFIFFYISQERQTCLFSATMPPEIMRVTQEYMRDAKEVMLNQELSLDTIEQCYLIIREREKFEHLCNLIKKGEKKQTIVFAATKKRTQRLANELKQEGFKAITIHGDLSQMERDNAMSKFKKGTFDILVATDIAARGIDVPAVGHIINYDIPFEPLMYFHRIGRTARAGARGTAISLVAHDKVDAFFRILRNTKHPIRRLNEEMGIGFITTQTNPHGRHRPRPDYRQNTNHRNHGRDRKPSDNRNMRSYREQRRYHRRYPRDNQNGIKPWKSLNRPRDHKKR